MKLLLILLLCALPAFGYQSIINTLYIKGDAITDLDISGSGGGREWAIRKRSGISVGFESLFEMTFSMSLGVGAEYFFVAHELRDDASDPTFRFLPIYAILETNHLSYGGETFVALHLGYNFIINSDHDFDTNVGKPAAGTYYGLGIGQRFPETSIEVRFASYLGRIDTPSGGANMTYTEYSFVLGFRL